MAQQPATPDSPDADHLRATERKRLRALVDVDMPVADALHADDYQLITPGGASLSRMDYLGGVFRGELNYRVFEPASEIAVRLFGDAAALRYRVRIEMIIGGEVDADEFWHTDIYERRTGTWQVVWSHATRIRRRDSGTS
jgi:hypothetical protein